MRKCCPTMVVKLKKHMFTPLCGLREKNTPREKGYGTNGLTPPDPKLLLICKNDGYL